MTTTARTEDRTMKRKSTDRAAYRQMAALNDELSARLQAPDALTLCNGCDAATASPTSAAGYCEACEAAAIAEQRAEREAEMAAERWYENGGAAAERIQAEDDEERERELYDPGLAQMRAAREEHEAELVRAGATEATCQGCPRCGYGATYPCPSQTRVWYESRDRRWFPAAR